MGKRNSIITLAKFNFSSVKKGNKEKWWQRDSTILNEREAKAYTPYRHLSRCQIVHPSHNRYHKYVCKSQLLPRGFWKLKGMTKLKHPKSKRIVKLCFVIMIYCWMLKCYLRWLAQSKWDLLMLLLANRPYIHDLISRDTSYSKDLSSVKHKPAQSWNTCLVFVYYLKIANIAHAFCNIFLYLWYLIIEVNLHQSDGLAFWGTGNQADSKWVADCLTLEH